MHNFKTKRENGIKSRKGRKRNIKEAKIESTKQDEAVKACKNDYIKHI